MLRHQLASASVQPEDIAETRGVPGVRRGRLHHRVSAISVDGGFGAHTTIYADGLAAVSSATLSTMTRSNASDSRPGHRYERPRAPPRPCARDCWSRRCSSQLQVRCLRVANRIVMAPMTREFSPGGVPGQDVVAYYRRRAEAETGLLITEGVGIDHPAALGEAGLGEADIPHLYGDEALAGWRASSTRCTRAGGKDHPAAVAPGRHARAGHRPASGSGRACGRRACGDRSGRQIFDRAGLRRARVWRRRHR